MVLNILMLYSTIIADSFFSFLFFLFYFCKIKNKELKSLLNQTRFKKPQRKGMRSDATKCMMKELRLLFLLAMFFAQILVVAATKLFELQKKLFINFSCRTLWKNKNKVFRMQNQTRKWNYS